MLVDLLFVAAVVGLLIAIYKIKFSKENVIREVEEETAKVLREREQQRRRDEALVNEPKPDEEREVETGANSESGWQGEESGSDSDQEGGDMRKKLRKQQKLKEKQQRKDAQEQYLQQQKEKRDKYEKQAEERERMEEERRRKEEAIIEQLRQEERKRKEEQFNKWKGLFSVQEQGKEKQSEQEQRKKAEAFSNQLVSTLKKAKLSLLQDLSHKFKLSTKEIVQRIKQLQQQQAISGIFDERGKYLVIEEGEWTAIRNYISARGRVKKTDIMTECARLIKIPDAVEEELLSLITDQEQAGPAQ